MKQLNSGRELRGLAILSKGDTIRKVMFNAWVVKSQTGFGEYRIKRVSDKKWYCTCPDFETHKMDCKHIFAVKFSIKLKSDVEEDVKEELPEKIEFKPANCPNCNGKNIIKSGKRKTERGKLQRYKCKECNFRFVIDKGFSKMKHTPRAITLSMDLYFKGISYRKICDHLKQFYNVKVNQTTTMRWIKKYLKLLAQYSDNYKADVSNIWHSDEMTVFIKKEGEEGYYEWIWNIMDSKTRYLLACKITKSRFTEDALIPLKDAKKNATKRPDVIVTDGLQAYRKAIKDQFYDVGAFIKNPHCRLKDFETKPNNNIVERLNGTIRERLKVMRSLSTTEGANEFGDAMRVYYNYIRPHQALGGLTPSQKANIPINLEGNRWLKMIELSKSSKTI